MAETLEELGALLDEAAEAAEVEADAEDDKAMKIARTTAKVVMADAEERKMDRLDQEFEATASDEAKRLLGIYRSGVEVTPERLRAMMDLAKTKAAETEKTPSAEEVEAAAQAEAERIAAEQYGASPIPPAEREAGKSDREVYDDLAERGRKGDSHASFLAFSSIPPGQGDKYRDSHPLAPREYRE